MRTEGLGNKERTVEALDRRIRAYNIVQKAILDLSRVDVGKITDINLLQQQETASLQNAFAQALSEFPSASQQQFVEYHGLNSVSGDIRARRAVLIEANPDIALLAFLETGITHLPVWRRYLRGLLLTLKPIDGDDVSRNPQAYGDFLRESAGFSGHVTRVEFGRGSIILTIDEEAFARYKLANHLDPETDGFYNPSFTPAFAFVREGLSEEAHRRAVEHEDSHAVAHGFEVERFVQRLQPNMLLVQQVELEIGTIIGRHIKTEERAEKIMSVLYKYHHRLRRNLQHISTEELAAQFAQFSLRELIDISSGSFAMQLAGYLLALHTIQSQIKKLQVEGNPTVVSAISKIIEMESLLDPQEAQRRYDELSTQLKQHTPERIEDLQTAFILFFWYPREINELVKKWINKAQTS